MTSAIKHMARRRPGESPVTAPELHRRNSQLREQFPPRLAQPWWPETAQGQEETLRRLTSPPFTPEGGSARAARRRGTAKILDWLAWFPGDTWQQRWDVSGVEAGLGASWVELPLAWLREHGKKASCDAGDLSSGLLMLACGDVVRPGLAWMLTHTNHHLAPVMAETRDPAGFARLRELAAAGPASARKDARLAATRIATLLACKGGVISDIAVGAVWRWPTPSGGCKPAAARRKSTSTSAFVPSGPSPATPRPRSGRLAWPGGSSPPRNWSTATGCSASRSATCSWTTCGNDSPHWTTPACRPSPRPWPACSGPGSRPCPRASARCGCRRTSHAPGRKTCRRSSAPSPAPAATRPSSRAPG